MNFHEMREAVENAEHTIRTGDQAAKDLAYLLRNRLQVSGVSPWTLTLLKRELRDWNMHTSEWKDPQP